MGTKHSWSPQNNCFVPPNSVYKHKTCKQCVDVVLKTQMMVARNGEDIYHCDSVANEALENIQWTYIWVNVRERGIERVTLSDKVLLTQKPSALQSCLSCAMTSDPKHVRKVPNMYPACETEKSTESSRNGLFVYKTGEFNMIYALLSLIPFVAIYALLGGPALTINSWLGDRN